MSLRNLLVALSVLAIFTAGFSASGRKSAPAFAGSAWLNAKSPVELGKGKVTIVHFWTFGCINCKHNLPSYAQWQREFSGKSFQIVGIHTPETSYEHSPSQLRAFLKQRGITYPILVDNDGTNWDRWNVKAWPTVFLVDKHGAIRDSWEGELDFDGARGTEKLGKEISDLIREN